MSSMMKSPSACQPGSQAARQPGSRAAGQPRSRAAEKPGSREAGQLGSQAVRQPRRIQAGSNRGGRRAGRQKACKQTGSRAAGQPGRRAAGKLGRCGLQGVQPARLLLATRGHRGASRLRHRVRELSTGPERLTCDEPLFHQVARPAVTADGPIAARQLLILDAP